MMQPHPTSQPIPQPVPEATPQSRQPEPRALSTALVLLFAIAVGSSVANVYFAHPLLDAIAAEFAISHSAVGLVIAATQAGYGLGLLLLVPLGDLLDRRRLIASHLLLSALALTGVGLAPTASLLLASLVAVGLLAVVVQTLVAYAATLAPPDERGRVVGIVTSGVVMGILLARVVAGVLADLGGWRAVYLTSAVFTLLMAGALFRALPKPTRSTATAAREDTGRIPAARPTYPQLICSVFTLFAEEPVLRVRAVLAMLIFAALNVFWTSLVLPLSAPPHALSHTAIGLFGLAGMAGALAAGRTGHWVDRVYANWTTGGGLAVMLIAWLPLAFTQRTLWATIAGVVLLDLAIQMVHVTNQGAIFAVRPEARSRLVAGYMMFYSIGSGLGSLASTAVYARAGWTGVCLLGAAISALAMLFWLWSLRTAHSTRRIRLAPAAQ